ncbi:MAG: hypothetical protein KUG77_25315 [Nannocystaceae bacterium]|nr:hypothetical protein [Nannocystaceae bacterium]
MSWTRTKVWRRIEDAVSGRLRASERAALFEELRDNETARADYDLTFEAIRALERAPVAQAELDVVEAWLVSDLEAQSVAEVAWWRRPWMGAVLAVAAAALLVVAIAPSGEMSEDDGFQARGATDFRGLAIDALCPQGAEPMGQHGLRPAAEYGCALAHTLSFAYRVDPAATGGVLSLFGVDEAGEVLYYAPTPSDAAGVDAQPGTWTPLPMVVQLGVNHGAGVVVVYGLVSSQAPTVTQVDTMAASLADASPAAIGDAAWHRRLSDDRAIAALCPEPTSCESAELSFTIYEANR